MRILLVFYLSLFTAISSLAQNDLLKGKVIDSETGFPVPYASILLVNKNQGMGANNEGRFQFKIDSGDTLQISSIGYETLTLALIPNELDLSKVNTFKLKPAVYELDSVEIYELSDNFYLKKPKRDTLDIGLVLPEKVRDWNQMQTLPLKTGDAGIVITGIFNDFDKSIKQQRIINEFNKAAEFAKQRQAERERYFNKELVKRVTRIDDRVIDEFMEFCNFLDGQIIGKSEYEITLLILKKYKEFLVR